MFDEFLNKPLAMLPQDARQTAAALAAGRTPAAFGMLGAAAQSPEIFRYELLPDGVALVTIRGPISNREDRYTQYLGMPTYQGITRAMLAAGEDPAVKAVMLDLDSGGGVVAGMFDAADAILTARRKKPVWALVDQHAFSAAYCLASAAEKIILPRTGGVGSIGVLCMHIDISKAVKDAGFKVTEIYAGSHKVDYSPHRSLADPAAQLLQAETDRVYQMFVESVARNRGADPAEVAATEAGLFWGPTAIDAGLADELADRETALAMLGAHIEGKGGGGGPAGTITLEGSMSKEATNNQATPPPAPAAGGQGTAQGGQPAPAAGGQAGGIWTPPPPPDADAALAAARAEGAAEATARITGILGLEEAKANPGLARALAADPAIGLDSAKAILAAAGPGKPEGGDAQATGTAAGAAQPQTELGRYMALHAPDPKLAPNAATAGAEAEEEDAEAAAIIAAMNANNGKGVTNE